MFFEKNDNKILSSTDLAKRPEEYRERRACFVDGFDGLYNLELSSNNFNYQGESFRPNIDSSCR